MLSVEQKDQHERKGYICPIPILDAGEVDALRSKLETFEAAQGGTLERAQRNKSHPLFQMAR